MTTGLTLSRPLNASLSRSGLLIAGLVLAGVCAASFVQGRSALEAAARADAIAIAGENQVFCVGLGFAPETGAYRKCVAGLGEIRLHQEQRQAVESAGLL